MISRLEFYRHVLLQKLKGVIAARKEDLLRTGPAQMLARHVARRHRRYSEVLAKALLARPERNMDVLVPYLKAAFGHPATGKRGRERIISDLITLNMVKEATALHRHCEGEENYKLVRRLSEYSLENYTKAFPRIVELSLQRGIIAEIYARHPDRKVSLPELPEVLEGGRSVAVICDRGPADEVFNARIYDHMLADAGVDVDSLTLFCDRRLLGLLQRSFPRLRFYPVDKKRFIGFGDYELYRDLPKLDLHSALCGRSYAHALQHDRIISPYHLLYRYRHVAFSGEFGSYLKPDAGRVRQLQRLFEDDTPCIGLMWKGSMRKIARDVFYYDIDHMRDLLQLPGVRFVILEEHLSRRERSILRSYGDRVIIFRDMYDIYNDFETLAALYEHLDLVVGPGSFNVMLAPVCGCPTFMLGTSIRVHGYAAPNGGYFSCRNARVIHNEDGSYDRHRTMQVCVQAVKEHLLQRRGARRDPREG